MSVTRSQPQVPALLLLALVAVLAGLVAPTPASAQPAETDVTRIGENDQSLRAFGLSLSQSTFADAGGEDGIGAEAVSAVFGVLGRDDVTMDALAAGPLLGGAPLLTVPGGDDGTLPDPVADELTRTLPPGSTVYLAGGEEAVSPAIETMTAELGFLPQRLGGEDRTATSVSIAEEVVRLVGAPEQILLAGSTSGAVVAGAYAADGLHPLLLVQGEGLSESATAFLDTHGPDAEVIVVGDEREVSAGAADAAGADRRIAGADPAETAAMVAELWPSDVEGATLVGPTPEEALARGVAGGTLLQPVLYCAAEPSDATRAALAGRAPVFALGGTDLLSDAAVSACLTPPDPSDGARVRRLAGADRIGTALDISRATFTDGSVGAVVLTRSDLFPDALAGTPLAVAEDAPLLLTPSDDLDGEVADELQRVLPEGGTVHLLGGPVALSEDVADDVEALGYETVRYGGANRFETAEIVTRSGLGTPDTVLLANGNDFPDALAAGAAAGAAGGGVLLTDGDDLPPATEGCLEDNGPELFAVGGPAAAAEPDATPLVGSDRVATSIVVAEEFFDAPTAVGVATSVRFPDALAGGAAVARSGGPLLLTPPEDLDERVVSYASTNAGTIQKGFVFGGFQALSAAVEQGLVEALAP